MTSSGCSSRSRPASAINQGGAGPEEATMTASSLPERGSPDSGVDATSSCALASAILRMSSVIFIEQYFGPHMLQKWALLKVSAGSVAS